MITSNSMPMSSSRKEEQNSIETPELIERLAAEMRASGDRELPISFYVDQVKRTLARERVTNQVANDEPALAKVPAASTSSVFQCWAMPE
ncbi:hypothetical protein [Rhizobium sp. RM]|uniref:hypothetical protein n=1 Tax=Rhizobium/Agrobacterium group TaxID=227290 RepID=UPI00110F24AE|nr:hypothetical protein [Rhizobium sp. RM]NWJ26799.1 hypothetical protein [Rhizobium sp. RM]TMV22674.1 hypothetical protein BJG94_01495 [Rhizobium sp. Td3]